MRIGRLRFWKGGRSKGQRVGVNPDLRILASGEQQWRLMAASAGSVFDVIRVRTRGRLRACTHRQTRT